jgi:hypothetical protein
MNANTTSFATAAPQRQDRPIGRTVSGPARILHGTPVFNECRPHALPLVLAVLPLRAVVREGRPSPRDA